VDPVEGEGERERERGREREREFELWGLKAGVRRKWRERERGICVS
jgi:hypothetical protein